MDLARVIKVDLSEYSEFWKDSYINLKTSYPEKMLKIRLKVSQINKDLTKHTEKGNEEKAIEAATKLIQYTKEIIKDHFVSGKVMNMEGNLVEIGADDLEKLDSHMIGVLSGAILGDIEKKG